MHLRGCIDIYALEIVNNGSGRGGGNGNGNNPISGTLSSYEGPTSIMNYPYNGETKWDDTYSTN